MNNKSKHAETIDALVSISFVPSVSPFAELFRRAAGIILMQEQRIHELGMRVAELEEDVGDAMLNSRAEDE